MADDYIGNVLGLLRKFKKNGLPNNAVSDNLRNIAGQPISESEVLRFAAYAHEQAAAAQVLINNSALPDEAKAGLIETTQAIIAACSVGGISSGLQNYFPKLDSSLSSFAILAGVRGVIPTALDIPEVVSLVQEIKSLRDTLTTYNLDPIVFETVMRHLTMLSVLLENIDAFGVDSAMVAYTDLVLRFRRSAAEPSEKSKAGIARLWAQIEQWTGRLTIIDHAINSGTGILAHIPSMATIIHQLPHIPVVT